jgi:hypothetical protein
MPRELVCHSITQILNIQQIPFNISSMQAPTSPPNTAVAAAAKPPAAAALQNLAAAQLAARLHSSVAAAALSLRLTGPWAERAAVGRKQGPEHPA